MKKIILLLLVLLFNVKGYSQSDCVDLELEEVSYAPAKMTTFGVPAGAFNNQGFGFDRTVVGDVNGDGHDDMLFISHPQDLSTRMWIAFLDEQGEAISVRKVGKITPNNYITGVQQMFGFHRWGSWNLMDMGRLAPIGDIDGNGVPDILIATDWHQLHGSQQKGAYGVGLLNSDGDIIATTTVQMVDIYYEAISNVDNISQSYCEVGLDSWHRLGVSADVIGDVNGDGIKDVVIGAAMNGYPGHPTSIGSSRDTQGRVYVIFLGADGRPLPGKVYAISSPTTSCTPGRQETLWEEFGNVVAGIGDIDGNGVPDIAVGSPDINEDTNNQHVDNGKGKIHIYLLGNDGRPISAPITIGNGTNGLQIDDLTHFGSGIAPIGDINCDGTPDIAASTSSVSGNPSKLYILYLDNQANLIHHQQINASPSTVFPTGVSALNYSGYLQIDKGKDWPKMVNGQLEQDGVNDILVSSSNSNADYFWRLHFKKECQCSAEQPCQTTDTTTLLTFPSYQLNEVINTSAQTLSDNWFLSEYTPLKLSGGSLLDESLTPPYTIGRQGIWRGESSFAYVTDRKQTSPSVNLSEDGTYTLNMFNWKYLGELDCPEWRKVETVSEYHPQSSDVERFNILKLYSSFHIGYDDQLVSAAAANSKQYEFGFEGFEQYDNTSIQSANSGLLFSTQGSTNIRVPYWFTLETGRNRRIWGPLELYTLKNQYTFDRLHVLGKQIDIHYPGEFRSHTLLDDITLNGEKSLIAFSSSEAAPFEGFWTGKVGITIHKTATQTFTGANPEVVEGIAHTGKKSLKVAARASFEQPYLLLIPNKKYVVSAWVRVEQNGKALQVASYQGEAQLEVELENSTAFTFEPKGQIIEGWQRIEGSFTVSSAGMGDWNIQLSSLQGKTVYFDDIRLFPSLGNMESFVYDTETFRLEAKLDANNYATFYYYDAEGRLYLVKQETARGIQTLQTVTTHTKKSE